MAVRVTEEALAELRKKIDVEFPVPMQFNEFATKDTIIHFAMGIDDTNPLWRDEAYAKKTKYGGIIAPPMFLESAGPATPRPWGLPGIHSMNAGSEFEYFIPVKVGDQIISTIALSGITEKPSHFAGRIFIQEWTCFFRNQRGELIAKQRRWSIRSERDEARAHGKKKDVTLATYTDEQIAAIWKQQEAEEIRGAKPRYWEDVKEGDSLGPVVKGPLLVTDIIAFKIGWGFEPFVFGSKFRLQYIRKHPGTAMKNSQGVPDIPERVHWEDEFAKQSGAAGAYDYGPQRGSWVCQLVTNWMGDDAWLKRLRYELRDMNVIGDTTWVTGKVTKKYVKDGEHLVDIDIKAENQRQQVISPGSATVLLPTKSK